ncbi:MAG: DsbA family protein [Patescibacteria group bacterium]|nr:DsbA family protein [Patescibacteria group bacterium]
MLEENKEMQDIKQGEQAASLTGLLDGPPKTMFYMGLLGGIAASTTLMLVYFVWAVSTGGVLPGVATAATQPVAQNPSAVEQPTDDGTGQEPVAGPVKPVDEKTDHILGPANAKVTIIEYSDFECPYCVRHFETVEQILSEYKDSVRLVYRHFPLTSIHPNAQKAAEASECAAELGGNKAFWSMHDKMFTAEGLSEDGFVQMAADIGLDKTKFKSCLDSDKYEDKVAQDQNEGASAGVQGTPATFVNGQLVSGAQPFANFKTMIDAALK